MTVKKTAAATKSPKAKKGVATGPVKAFRQKMDVPVVAADSAVIAIE